MYKIFFGIIHNFSFYQVSPIYCDDLLLFILYIIRFHNSSLLWIFRSLIICIIVLLLVVIILMFLRSNKLFIDRRYYEVNWHVCFYLSLLLLMTMICGFIFLCLSPSTVREIIRILSFSLRLWVK